jgi:hypothetical protein
MWVAYQAHSSNVVFTASSLRMLRVWDLRAAKVHSHHLSQYLLFICYVFLLMESACGVEYARDHQEGGSCAY